VAPITALPVREPVEAVPGRGRGNRDRVLLSVGDALAGPLEGISACDEAAVAFDRIAAAVQQDNLTAAYNLARTGQHRVIRSAAELRRMVADIEVPDGAA
jgi:hypothetical protein